VQLISGTRAVESAGILAMESWYSLGHGAGHRGTRDAKSEIKEIDKEIAFIRVSSPLGPGLCFFAFLPTRSVRSSQRSVLIACPATE
jgi:hypothetical protein